jgi:DNA-directed RNA polymerase subunit RPC12/RpoP
MAKKPASGDDFLYPMQFACFGCRKSFKQHMMASQVGRHEPKCPQCGERMSMMGRAFKAPMHSDIKQWQKVELLVNSGFLFSSHNGKRPKTLREAKALVETKRSQ